jgi:hypothetical protein
MRDAAQFHLGLLLALALGNPEAYAQPDSDDTPRIAPANEQQAQAPEFETACLNSVMISGLGRSVVLGRRLVTRSTQFGLVWRADFGPREQDGLINRIVCWQRPDGKLDVLFAYSEHESPL